MKSLFSLLLLLSLPACSSLDQRGTGTDFNVSPRAGNSWSVGIKADIGRVRTGPAWTFELIDDPEAPDAVESEPPINYPLKDK
tara:strand:- start:7962 stop:8210 length:249 start_codon:yes stop_codon:yes gene_type:complete